MWIDAPEGAAEGEEFIVRVNISEVTDIDVAQYDLAYDPEVLELEDVTDGYIGGTKMPVDMWGFVPYGEQGTARVLNNVGGTPGISGEGYLAELHFEVVGSAGDMSDISFVKGEGVPAGELLLGDKEGEEMFAIWKGDSVPVKN